MPKNARTKEVSLRCRHCRVPQSGSVQCNLDPSCFVECAQALHVTDGNIQGVRAACLDVLTVVAYLAASRSILLTTTMTFLLSARDFLRTNRVCGIGPSTESTSSSTPAPQHRPSLEMQQRQHCWIINCWCICENSWSGEFTKQRSKLFTILMIMWSIAQMMSAFCSMQHQML